jgi:endonuclease/exonuclease/phosphatase family metal-dependent hydrolase
VDLQTSGMGRPPSLGAALLAIAIGVAGCSGGGQPAVAGRSETGTVRVVSQNLLHGINCPAASNRCDLSGRVALFMRELDEKGCPDLVGVQEANERTVALLRQDDPKVCRGRYRIVWDGDPGLDREVVLTRLPVLGWRRAHLAGPLRTALWVRVAADVGVVDFVSSHLASGSDDRPCDRATCPTPCRADERINVCQAWELVELARQVADHDAVVIVGGDFNATPREPAIAVLSAGGFIDTHLAEGNPECDRANGAQCTSGRADNSLTDLTDPSSRQSERIDYLFVGGARACRTVKPTGLFNAEPAKAGAGALVFPADHTGVQATLECRTTEAQRQAAVTATVTSAPTTTTHPPEQADPETLAAITEAFGAVFNGDVTDVDVKLASLEDGQVLRPFFLQTYEATKAIAARVRVRLDAVKLVDATHANVTYTLLLGGAAVLDHLSGAAVRIGGRWLVTRHTYCEVSTQGASTIPPVCQ